MNQSQLAEQPHLLSISMHKLCVCELWGTDRSIIRPKLQGEICHDLSHSKLGGKNHK